MPTSVGKLDDSHASMLHLELHCGTSTCALTVRSNEPYERRADLLDLTTWLVAASV